MATTITDTEMFRFSKIEKLQYEEVNKKSDRHDTVYISDDILKPDIFLNQLLNTRSFLSNEPWDKVQNIHSRVLKISKDMVTCECLIDKEKNIFENRNFPKYLFNHIEKLNNNPYIILTIKSKTGSTRIDILDGEKLVDKKRFELKDSWDDLEGSDFGVPLNSPIRL